MDVEYINPWEIDQCTEKPKVCNHYNVKKVMEHRGFSVYRIHEKHYDWVFSGVCVAQFAGFNSTRVKTAIDNILCGCVPNNDWDTRRVEEDMVRYQKYMK